MYLECEIELNSQKDVKIWLAKIKVKIDKILKLKYTYKTINMNRNNYTVSQKTPM